MPYRLVASLVLLRHGAGAFRAPPNGHRGIGRRNPREEASADAATSPLGGGAAALDSIPSLESILDDGRGHVNGELARAVYEWEAALDGHESSKHFSTRDGLRLVEEQGREILSSLEDGDGDGDEEGGGGTSSSGVLYGDLIQEGVIALLRAMSTYDTYKSHNDNATFRDYARRTIHSSLLHFLAHSSRPFRLPLSLETTLEAANSAADALRESLGREPSLVQVADAVGVDPARLALYRRLRRGTASGASGAFVSVEDGVEVYDPTLAGAGTGPRSRRDLDPGREAGEDVAASASSASGSSSAALDDPVAPGLDERGEDDDWTGIPPDRVVAPLRDVLADGEAANDPLSRAHRAMLNERLDDLLRWALTDEERTVVRLRFGLEESKRGGRGWTANEIGGRLGMTHDDVVRVAGSALEKLREAAATWDDDDDAALVEVSL